MGNFVTMFLTKIKYCFGSSVLRVAAVALKIAALLIPTRGSSFAQHREIRIVLFMDHVPRVQRTASSYVIGAA